MKVIVIGAGAAGLCAAASLAKMGADVTVYEKNTEIGGALKPARADGYAWSRSYSLQRFLEGQFFERWIRELGGSIQAVRTEQRYVFPDFTIGKPEGAAPGWLRTLLEERFPSEKRGLKRFWSFCDRMRTIAAAQEEIEFNQSAALKRSVIWNYFFVSRYVDLRADALLDRFFRNAELKKILLAVLTDKGTDPEDFAGIGLPLLWSEASFDAGQPLERADNLSETGICQILGGTEKLVQAMADALQSHGGKIVTGKAVKKIVIEKNAVRSVELEDGTAEKAGEGEALAVVIASDPRNALVRMVGREHLPQDVLEIMEKQELRSSAFAVHLGLNDAVQTGSAVTHVCPQDTAAVLRGIREGVFDPERQGCILYSSSAWGMDAPEGKKSLTILAFAPRRAEGIDWEKDKERLADRLIALAEKQIPGLKNGIETRLIETPDDYARFGNDAGCVGGLTSAAGRESLPHAVEGIRGLYLAGQYTGGGGGVGTVMRGAWQTARAIESDYFLDATQNRDDGDDDPDDLDA